MRGTTAKAAVKRPRLQLNANDCDARASKRGVRRIGGRRKNRTHVRKSRRPARQPRQTLAAERKKQAAVVVAARNCNWARERGKAQSSLCRRSSAEQFQTRIRTLPMP